MPSTAGTADCAGRKLDGSPNHFMAGPAERMGGAGRMRRTLSSALAARPLFFEVTPPSARAPLRRGEDHLEKILGLLRELPRVDLVDVPELVDENHEGLPFYRSGDIRPFATKLGAASGCAVAVNKVVAHLPSTPAVEAWTRETLERGLANVVLVGGSSRFIPYPGPSVLEADRACLPILDAGGGRIGNIAIPQRTGEAHRLLSKTRAGASFFTTQILFESASPLTTIREDGPCAAVPGSPRWPCSSPSPR